MFSANRGAITAEYNGDFKRSGEKSGFGLCASGAGQKFSVGAGTKGDCGGNKMRQGFWVEKNGDKTSSGAAVEPPARALLRSMTNSATMGLMSCFHEVNSLSRLWA